MADHPIQGLMQTAMENIKDMVDVNTIVGDPVETPDGSVIIPISKVGFGFAAGGSEFIVEGVGKRNGSAAGNGGQGNQGQGDQAGSGYPFGGGSGGGVSITPIAFLVVGGHGVKVVPLDNSTHLYEKIIDLAPQVVDKLKQMMERKNEGVDGFDTSNPSGVQPRPVDATIQQ